MVLVNVLSNQGGVILLVPLDVEKIHDGLLVCVETEKLALHSWVLKHLIDLLGVQSAASLLLSVLVTRLTGPSSRTVGTRLEPKCGHEGSRPGQLPHAVLLEGPNKCGHRDRAAMPTMEPRGARHPP